MKLASYFVADTDKVKRSRLIRTEKRRARFARAKYKYPDSVVDPDKHRLVDQKRDGTEAKTQFSPNTAKVRRKGIQKSSQNAQACGSCTSRTQQQI